MGGTSGLRISASDLGNQPLMKLQLGKYAPEGVKDVSYDFCLECWLDSLLRKSWLDSLLRKRQR